MKFEDLKLPKIVNEHELNVVRDVTARAVYDQMRAHYETTKRPAIAWRWPKPPVEYVPLGPEDVPPGSAVRIVGCNDRWEMVVAVDSVCFETEDIRDTWRELYEKYEILRPNSTAWEPCKKLKA